jgi:ribose transport system substrate-binding protein
MLQTLRTRMVRVHSWSTSRLPGRRGVLGAIAACTALSVGIVGFTTSAASAKNAASSPKSSGKVYTIYLSNSYIGNPWRQQMENYAKAVAAQPAYKNHVKLVILNSSENTVSSQIASLQTAIRAKPNALLIDAVSSTALNATVQQACNAGIIVYSFDQGITAPCAYKLLATPSTTGDNMAEWMGTALHGKGDVLLDIGNAGAAYSDGMTAAIKTTMAKKFPNIKIVATYASSGNAGTEIQAVSSLLSANRDVSGVMSEAYCSSIYQAFNHAGLKQPTMGCLDSNQSATFCMQKKLHCYLYTASPWVSALALVHAYNQLSGKTKYPKFVTNFNNVNFVTPSANVKMPKFPDAQINSVLKNNVSYFPALSPNLILPVTGQGLNLTVKNALNG